MNKKLAWIGLAVFLSSDLFAGVASDYAFAQKCYYSVKSEGEGAKPSRWDNCIEKFLQVQKKYPGTAQAPKALFSGARLAQEKYTISKEKEELEKAIKLYNQFLREFPQDALADDTLFRIGVLRAQEFHDRERAIKAFQTLLERYPSSEQAVATQSWLEKLQGKQVAPPPVPIQTSPPKESKQKTAPPEKSFRVIIDPGHGGADPGAIGSRGIKEKNVTLQVAKKLAARLKTQMKWEVWLTRTKDETVSLQQRNRFAAAKNADLFISIHANSNENRALSGVQTFYLNNATSEASRRLAERENREAGGKLGDVEKILSSMLQNANTEESRDLAHAVHRKLLGRLQKYGGVQDLRVDTALFYVLVGAKCPAILVETSFVSNPKEELRLEDSAYQWDLAAGIADGLKHFFSKSSPYASNL